MLRHFASVRRLAQRLSVTDAGGRRRRHEVRWHARLWRGERHEMRWHARLWREERHAMRRDARPLQDARSSSDTCGLRWDAPSRPEIRHWHTHDWPQHRRHRYIVRLRHR